MRYRATTQIQGELAISLSTPSLNSFEAKGDPHLPSCKGQSIAI